MDSPTVGYSTVGYSTVGYSRAERSPPLADSSRMAGSLPLTGPSQPAASSLTVAAFSTVSSATLPPAQTSAVDHQAT